MDNLKNLTKEQLIAKLNDRNESGYASLNDHENQMEQLDRMATVNNPYQIPFSTKNDHKNVMLYTALNKRVGPLHPENAKHTMMRYKRLGFQLYMQPRTDEQIEDFKKTDLYKREHAKHLAERKLRHAQSSKGKTEQLVESVATAVAKATAKNG